MRCKKCGKCCEDTLMELRLRTCSAWSKLAIQGQSSRESDDGIWRLLNAEGHCVFLEPTAKVCSVYDLRPLCYIYPVEPRPDGTLIVDRDLSSWRFLGPRMRRRRRARCCAASSRRSDAENQGKIGIVRSPLVVVNPIHLIVVMRRTA